MAASPKPRAKAAPKPKAKPVETSLAPKRVTVEQLRKVRTKVVTITIDGKPVELTIAKLKMGQRRELREQCIEDGIVDLDKAAQLAAKMCVVDPIMTAEDIEEIDLDVFYRLAGLIEQHSGSDAGAMASLA